ncbi:MAG TPA: PRC-barrel domain-containing protein [Armatimonadota bacterium]
MQANEILKLKVLDIVSGSTLGSVTGMLIDGDKRQVVALEVGGGLLSRPDYLPFGSIKSIENDVLTISSSEVLVERGEFKTSRLVGDLSGRKVFTEDGKHLGTVHEYDVDTENGKVILITVALDTAVLGGLWRSAGERFDIPRSLITTLGDSIIVDSAVPNTMQVTATDAA